MILVIPATHENKGFYLYVHFIAEKLATWVWAKCQDPTECKHKSQDLTPGKE